LVDDFLKSRERVEIFNVGTDDRVRVAEIARTVAAEMGKPNIKYSFSGGIEDGRGWKGDVKVMQLSVDKLLRTGWRPKHKSLQAAKLAAKDLIKEIVDDN
jgi:UDP-glucose 4-epimerase